MAALFALIFVQLPAEFLHSVVGGVTKSVPLSLQEMSPHHEDNMTSMNLNMYPSTEGHTFPPGAQRIWSHTDYEALTLLFQKPGDNCYSCTFPPLLLLHVLLHVLFVVRLLFVRSHMTYKAVNLVTVGHPLERWDVRQSHELSKVHESVVQ